MAQDFGDDMGERLFRLIGRAASYAVRDWLREQEYARRLAERDTQGQSAATQPGANAPARPEQVCIPFGQADDAALFAKVAQEQKIQMEAFSDRDGNGFVRFRTDELERVQTCSERFVEAMTHMNAERVAQSLESALPVTEEQMRGLTQIRDLPDLPQRDAKARTEPTQQPQTARPDLGAVSREARAVSVADQNLTEAIADKVREARESCRAFDDFKEILAERGVGVTTTKDGEVMFYEARRDADGKLLPFGRDENGSRDWAVGARTLKERYGVDATHDWFERNTPQASDGSLDADGRTPDINQGIESHDGMDTDARTLRLEREQTGTDVAPSKVREEQAQARADDRSLSSVSEQCRAASKQLEAESGVIDRELDISDKLSPVR